MFLFTVLLPFLLCAGGVLAYIPAAPTNDTVPFDLFDPDDPSHIELKYKSFDPLNDVLVSLARPQDSSGTSQVSSRVRLDGCATLVNPSLALHRVHLSSSLRRGLQLTAV